MASQALIDEYHALGGTDDVAALSDDDLALKMMILQGEQIKANAAPVTLDDMGIMFDGDHKAMNDQELMASLVAPEAMEAFAATGAVDQGALTEQRLRDLTDSRNFIENLSDPETANYITDRYVRQAAGSALNTLDIPAQAAGLYGLGTMGIESLVDQLNGETPPGRTLINGETIEGESNRPDLGSAGALDYANDRYMAALETVRVSEPRNVGESIASVAGMMIPVPGPSKMNAAGNIAEMMTPLLIGGNRAPRLAVNVGAGVAIDQSIREMVDTKETQYETMFDMIGTGDVDGLEGMELAALAGSLAIPFFPVAASRALATTPVPTPTIRQITEVARNGPEDLYTMTTARDVQKGYLLSDTDSIIEIARRAGVPDIDGLKLQFDTTTQSGASARVTEAMNTGVMPTVHGTFTAPVAPRQLAAVYDLLSPAQQADANNYMLLGNYSDVIKRRNAMDADAMVNWQKALLVDPQAPKPTMVSKPTDAQELIDISKQRDAMRMSIPMLDQYSKGAQQLTEAARNFISQGPFALIDPKTAATFAKEQPHYIPISLSDVDPTEDLLSRMVDARMDPGFSDVNGWLEHRDLGKITMDTLGLQDNAVNSLVTYTQSMLHAQLKNNAKGAYVDQMLLSVPNQNKTPLIRKATKEEMKDVKQADRIVTIVRNGKTENYITERYIAQVLALDPYVLTNPIAMGLHATKRAFEVGTTGVMSLTFPATSLIRDTLGGWANTKKGVKAPGFGVITAPVEILGAKAMKSFYTMIDDHLAAGKDLFIPGMDAAAQKQLSARLAATYQNTFYHMAQQFGGYDASVMKDRIVRQQGRIGEMINSIPQPISRTYGVTLKPIFAGIGAIMDSLLEAPRYNVAKRNTKDVSWSGTVRDADGLEEALSNARKLTGDTSKSGRSYDNQGRLITGDVVNKKTSVINPMIGFGSEAGRVAAPYFNPMVKGFERVYEAFVADPVRFAARNWLAVGLPATVGYAWNSMLSSDSDEGYDYLDYQFNQRSSDEQVMEIYFGIPGQPPEKGLSIPIAHESTPFMSPFTTMLNHMGSSGPEIQRALTQVGLGIAQNTLQIGLPPSLTGFLSMNGVSGMDTMIGVGGNSPYETREDNVGVLPQNIENMVRNMFGTQAAMGLEAISAFAEDGNVAHAAEEYLNSIAKRLPIVKGLGGWRTNSAYFTPIAAEQRMKLDAYYAFDDAWKLHFSEEGLVTSPSSPAPAYFPDVDNNGDELQFPLANVGPQPTMKPVNPLYELYGQQIHDSLAKKDPYGFPVTRAQMGALTEQVRLLKGFNAGRADDFKALQDLYEGIDVKIPDAQDAVDALTEEYDALPRGTKTTTPEGRALKEQKEAAEETLFRLTEYQTTAKFLEENNIDLGDRFDVIRLTNLMEQRRVDLMKYQLSIIEQVENDLTMQLQAEGMLPAGEKFSFEKHLAPMENPAAEVLAPPPQQQPTAAPAV